jgi:hypothetical protein
MAVTPDSTELQSFYNGCFQVNQRTQIDKINRKSGIMLDLLGRFLPGKGRLLEIGSSYGHFLDRARQTGWKLEGVEISHRAAQSARQ